jgi:hypothetical protein
VHAIEHRIEGLAVTDEKSPEPPPAGRKKFVLKIRERQGVPTSQGTYFVRHLVTSDLPTFSAYSDLTADQKSQDLPALGELAIKTFTCLEEKSDTPSPLSEEVYSALSAEDLKALAEGIAEVGELGALPERPALEALGALLLTKLRFYAKQAAETAAKIKKAMDTSFGSMSASVKASLADSLSGMAAIRESLRETSAVAAMRKEIETQNRILGQLPKDLISPIDYAKQLGLGSGVADELLKINEDHAKLSGLMPKTVREELVRQAQTTKLNVHTLGIPIYQPPPVSETPMGRAAIAGEESARQLREVAGLAGQMTDKIASLSEVMLTKVLPEWFRNLKEGSDATNDSLEQAKTSVNLAKKAILWSIFVTVAMTIWQLWVAREYKLENDAQQTTTEALMRAQLKESQALNKQLAEDSKRLNEQLTKMSQALAASPSSKATTTEHRPAPGPAPKIAVP